MAHQLSSIAVICFVCMTSRDRSSIFISSWYRSKTSWSNLWYWIKRATEESEGNSSERESVAAHASVSSVKDRVFGLSIEAERLQRAATISVVSNSITCTNLHA